MSQSKSRPEQALVIRTYDELQQYARAFAEGHLNLLFLIGPPGLGKSRCLRDVLGAQACWLNGNASPFGIYLAAFEFRDQPLVLDDVDGFYRDRQGIRLLKSLCQTEPVKQLSWQSSAATLQKQGIPQRFTTSSPVAIIANQWKSLNADVAALEDRGHLIDFAPDALEVHRQAATWFWDQEIFDFVAEHLHLMELPSLRVYVLAWELKQAKLDWKPAILGRCLQGTALEVAKLKADPSFSTEKERVRAFVDAGLGCRATYFNYAQKLQQSEKVPRITLPHRAPPAPPSQTGFDVLEFLQQRFGRLGNG